MAKKAKVTGRGVLVYPHLNTADFKYKKDAGEYHARLRQDSEEGQSLKAEIDTAMAESLKEAEAKHAQAIADEADPAKKKKLQKIKIKPADNLPYDEDEEEGTIAFNFKMTASGKSRKTGKPYTQAPLLVDAKMNVIDPAKVNIGGGSVAKISYYIDTFWNPLLGAGVSLKLVGAQIIELKQYTRDAKSMGFGAEEGYEVEDEEGQTTAAALAGGFTAEAEDDDEKDEPTTTSQTTGSDKDDF